MRRIMRRLKLTVNEAKTRRLPTAEGTVRLPGLHASGGATRRDGRASIWACGRRRRASRRIGEAIHEHRPEDGVDERPGMVQPDQPQVAGLGQLL